jgi:6-phosphofructokinase
MSETLSSIRAEHRAKEEHYFRVKYHREHPYPLGAPFEVVGEHCRVSHMAFQEHMKEYDLRVFGIPKTIDLGEYE